jgi:hypothetical protein
MNSADERLGAEMPVDSFDPNEFRQKWAWIRGVWLPIENNVIHDDRGVSGRVVVAEEVGEEEVEVIGGRVWYVPVGFIVTGLRPTSPPPHPIL